MESATGYLNQVAERLRDLGVVVNMRTARNAPAEAILAYATQRPDLRLIALATHGRTGVTRWLLGSVAETVVQGADQPVLLVRAPAEEASTVMEPVAPYTKILVALDGSARAEHVLADARSLAAATGASLLLLTVLPALDENPGIAEAGTIHGPESPQHEARQAAHTYLAGLAQPLAAARVSVQTMIGYGHPAEAIVQIAAQERADVIALATHGRGGWQRLRWGSVTQEVVHQAETPVLVIRPNQHIGE